MKKFTAFVVALSLLLCIVGCAKTGPAAQEPAPENEAPANNRTPDTEAPTDETEVDDIPEIDYQNGNADTIALVELIDTIDGISLENEDAIDTAYYAYYQLPEEDRVYVTNWDSLLTLRQELPKLYIVGERQGDKVPWHEFRIGTYAYPASLWNDKDVATLAASGVDFICGVDFNERLMTLLDKYNIGAFVNADSVGLVFDDAGLFSDIRMYAPDPVSNPVASYVAPHTEEEVRTAAEKAQDVVSPYASVWGLELQDEPTIVDFQHLGRYMAIVDEIMPNLTSYLNVFPNYTSPWNLVTVNYENYLREIHEQCDVDYTCLDHYMYSFANNRAPLARFINNLEVSQDVSNEYGKEMWFVLQANQDLGAPLEINRLKIQAYLAMAYGCKSINFACWSGADCWFDPEMQITDVNGDPTQRYYDLQEIIADLDALGPVFMRYTATTTCAIGDIYDVLDLDYEIGLLKNYTGDPEMLFDMTVGEFNVLGTGLGGYDPVYMVQRGPMAETANIKVDNDFLAQNDTTLGQDVFADFAVAEEDAAILIGGFKKNVGEGSAVMLVNITDSSFTGEDGKESRDSDMLLATVTFTVNQSDAVVTMYVKGIPTVLTPVDGVYTVNMNAADAVFITVE